MTRTAFDFDEVIETCFAIYQKKLNEYGVAWQILRLSSLTDQIFIKAQRIRNIQELGKQKVEDSIWQDFAGILNYSIITLIQIRRIGKKDTMSVENAIERYKEEASKTKKLLLLKNHDYNEAWREMRLSSIIDLILVKIRRIKQIENLNGNMKSLEQIKENYYDIINYVVFALIKIKKFTIEL